MPRRASKEPPLSDSHGSAKNSTAGAVRRRSRSSGKRVAPRSASRQRVEAVGGGSPGEASEMGGGTLFFLYASVAGVCGALSGVVGKLAVASATAGHIAEFIVRVASSTEALAPLLRALPLSGPPSLLAGWAGAERSRAGAVSPREAQVALLSFYTEVVLRVLLMACNLVFTGQMWRFFLKSLSLGPTPVAQIINTGTNFAASAFLGLALFHEEVSASWAAGALLVVLGLALVVTDPRAAHTAA